ncbi:ubiquitin-activating E1 FCCH domain-containing protein [Caulobacter segnis]
MVTTSTTHGFITGDQISFAGLSGLTTPNGTTWTITNLTATTFDTGVVGSSTTGTYTSGGAATCEQSVNPGCNKLALIPALRIRRRFEAAAPASASGRGRRPIPTPRPARPSWEPTIRAPRRTPVRPIRAPRRRSRRCPATGRR